MTIRKANNLIHPFNGSNKTDNDFIAMIRVLSNNGLALMDGKNEYNSNMTCKRYHYRVVKDDFTTDGEWKEGKTIGYLSAQKCFVNGIENNFEILAYIS